LMPKPAMCVGAGSQRKQPSLFWRRCSVIVAAQRLRNGSVMHNSYDAVQRWTPSVFSCLFIHYDNG